MICHEGKALEFKQRRVITKVDDLHQSTNISQLVGNIPVFDWHHQVVFGVHQLCSQVDESYDAPPPRKQHSYRSRNVFQ